MRKLNLILSVLNAFKTFVKSVLPRATKELPVKKIKTNKSKSMLKQRKNIKFRGAPGARLWYSCHKAAT